MGKMLNNYLFCEEIESSESKNEFNVESNERFIVLRVTSSNEEDIPVDSRVLVSINSGDEYKDKIIIRRDQIIEIE